MNRENKSMVMEVRTWVTSGDGVHGLGEKIFYVLMWVVQIYVKFIKVGTKMYEPLYKLHLS